MRRASATSTKSRGSRQASPSSARRAQRRDVDHLDPRHRLERRRLRPPASTSTTRRSRSRAGAGAATRTRRFPGPSTGARRGAARPAGHAVRRRIGGRHGTLHHAAQPNLQKFGCTAAASSPRRRAAIRATKRAWPSAARWSTTSSACARAPGTRGRRLDRPHRLVARERDSLSGRDALSAVGADAVQRDRYGGCRCQLAELLGLQGRCQLCADREPHHHTVHLLPADVAARHGGILGGALRSGQQSIQQRQRHQRRKQRSLLSAGAEGRMGVQRAAAGIQHLVLQP